MSEDFYLVLGVEKSATQAEIKQAYRGLARKYHPDKNPGDAAAESKFKDAAEAYRVLGDADLRAQYDSHQGRGGGGGGGGVSGETPEDVLRDIFGTSKSARSGGRSAPRETRESRSTQPRSSDSVRGRSSPGRSSRSSGERGNDLKYELEVGFDEAVLGSQAEIVVASPARCRTCGGTGSRPGTAVKICDECRGSGTVRVQQGFFDRSERCNVCAGTGRRTAQDCPSCDGSGVEEGERSLSVPIPAGVTSGTRLRVEGEGSPGQGGGPPGDLIVVVTVRPDPLFEREGDDLLTEVPVTFTEAVLGTQIEIPTLEGLVRMRIPPGSQSGRVFRLKGKGFPLPHGESRGDQRVRILVDVPLTLSDEQRELLERFAEIEAAGRSGNEKVDEFRRLLKDRYG